VKVNDASLNSAAVSQLDRTASADPAGFNGGKGGASQASGDADRVQLSDFYKQLLQRVSTPSPDHGARLQQLSAQVRGGNYQVNAAAVSSRIVDDALSNA